MVQFVDWIQCDSTTSDTCKSTNMAILCALGIPLLNIATHFAAEHINFDIIVTSWRCHTSLKSILSAKKMRMSASVNKDFSEGEISSLMFGDTNLIGDIPFNLSIMIDSSIVFITSVYFTFTYLGWYGFIVLILTSLQLSIGYWRANRSKNLSKKKRDKFIERIRYINESF